MLGENGQVGGNPVNVSKVMKITEDGIKTVIVRVQDRAGNITNPITIEVKADNTKPREFEAIIEEKSTGFVIKASTTDATSGISHYNYYINGELKGTSKDGNYEIKELNSSTAYSIYIEAVDYAGNIRETTAVTKETGKALPEPTIVVEKLEGTEERSGWYTGDVRATISYIADEEYGDLKLKYKINGGNEKTSTNITTEVVTISEEGITTIEAYTEDVGGEKSKVVVEEIKIDTSSPEKPEIIVKGTTGDRKLVWSRYAGSNSRRNGYRSWSCEDKI